MDSVLGYLETIWARIAPPFVGTDPNAHGLLGAGHNHLILTASVTSLATFLFVIGFGFIPFIGKRLPPGPPRDFKPGFLSRASSTLPLWRQFAILQKQYGMYFLNMCTCQLMYVFLWITDQDRLFLCFKDELLSLVHIYWWNVFNFMILTSTQTQFWEQSRQRPICWKRKAEYTQADRGVSWCEWPVLANLPLWKLIFGCLGRGELLSDGMRGVMMPYGTRWRNWRSVSLLFLSRLYSRSLTTLIWQVMHAGMSIEASSAYKPLQSMESKILLHDLLFESDPAQYFAHLRRYVYA